MLTKQFPVDIQKSDTEEFDAKFVMSAASPDRLKDTIDPAAYIPATKLKSLIALWQHDSDKPIGFWKNLEIKGDKLVGHIKFASTNLAQMVKTLISDSVPLAASIGFRGKGEPNKVGGIHFKEMELLECSIVSVPAHPRAQQIAKSFGVDLVKGDDTESAAVSGHEDVVKRAAKAIINANRTLRTKS